MRSLVESRDSTSAPIRSYRGSEHSEVVAGHIRDLVGQLTRIIGDGIANGEFAAADPEVTARAVFDATARFHDPAHAAEWPDPGIDAAFDAVCALILAGLRTPGRS